MRERTIIKYYDEIFRYCFHHLGDREAAEDVCQDTFVSFIEHEGEYCSRGKLKNYLYTIARNKCIDYSRKKTPVYTDKPPDRRQEGGFEDKTEIRQLVEQLPEEYRQVILLRFFQGLTFAEIARILGVSASAAKYRVKRALELLQKEVEGHGH